jgi:hypothetical protein
MVFQKGFVRTKFDIYVFNAPLLVYHETMKVLLNCFAWYEHSDCPKYGMIVLIISLYIFLNVTRNGVFSYLRSRDISEEQVKDLVLIGLE